MIVFDLRCAPQGHVFEAWFASSAAYADQRAGGLVACPLCGSAEVAKGAVRAQQQFVDEYCTPPVR